MHKRSIQKGLKCRVLFLVFEHFTGRLVLINAEVGAVLLQDLNGPLRLERVQLTGHLASPSTENLEFSTLEKIVEVGYLADELLEENAPLLQELVVLVVLHLHLLHVDADSGLLGDGRNVATRPSVVETALQRLELIEASLAGPLASRVSPSHSVLCDLSNFLGVSHLERERSLLHFVLVVLTLALHLLALRVERHNLLNQLRLGIVRPHVKVAAPCRLLTSHMLLLLLLLLPPVCRGLRVGRCFGVRLLLLLGAAEAHWGLLLRGGVRVGGLGLLGYLLRLILFFLIGALGGIWLTLLLNGGLWHLLHWLLLLGCRLSRRHVRSVRVYSGGFLARFSGRLLVSFRLGRGLLGLDYSACGEQKPELLKLGLKRVRARVSLTYTPVLRPRRQKGCWTFVVFKWKFYNKRTNQFISI